MNIVYVAMNNRFFNWPHIISCVLVASTMVLLCFGALVTTYEAAMAVPDWPATYGHNMFLFPWSEWVGGPWDLFLEHGHRLLGAVVGFLSLVMVFSVWKSKASPVVKALAFSAVLLVVVQGMLGGARVLLDDKTIAKVHACTGPLFFSVATAIAVLTRRNASFLQGGSPSSSSQRMSVVHNRRTGLAAAGLVVAAYVQLVAGAQLRHIESASIGPRAFQWMVGFHVVGAFVVMGLVLTLAILHGRIPSVARRWSWLLACLVVGQIVLGVASWIVSWGVPSGLLPFSFQFSEPFQARSTIGALIVTGHVLLGMLILGASVILWIVGGGLRIPDLSVEAHQTRQSSEEVFV